MFVYVFVFLVFFFKQKTAYEMRISDWSSDVCSSDLADEPFRSPLADQGQPEHDGAAGQRGGTEYLAHARGLAGTHVLRGDRRAGECHRNGRQEDRQIGRASCRERVCQYV